MATPDGPTPFPELNDLVLDLAHQAREILGTNFIGAYLQGSFALGDADQYSDCDFLVVVAGRPSPEQEAALRILHEKISTGDGHWNKVLQGSYAHAGDLADVDTIGAEWLYIGHGAREMQWSRNCNSAIARWILREHGVTLLGPPPSELVAPISPDLLRETARRQLPTFLDNLSSWASPFEVAWVQRYMVTTYCRLLYRLTTGQGSTKPTALRWAMTTLDPRWLPLLTQVLNDRERGSDFTDRSRPGSIKASLEFAAYAVSLIDTDLSHPVE